MVMRSRGLLAAICLMALALAGCGSVPRAPGGDAAPRRPFVPAARGKNAPRAAQLPAAGSGRGGYYQDDGPGDTPPDDLLDTPDAIPDVEPYSRHGNKPYVVFGKTYTPITDGRAFKQRGIGSWYGKKFNGQKTSSGERYDMYQMSAAHPTLPIPSYARVTNLDNGAQVIVRVNDRGPFHSGRIIDLSYTAALKLGYLGKGSGQLEVERLLPDEIERIVREQKAPVQRVAETAPVPVEPPPAIVVTTQTTGTMALGAPLPAMIPETSAVPAPLAITKAAGAGGFYLQIGAYEEAANAEAVRARLLQNWAGLPPIEVAPYGVFYRLYGGPFASRAEASFAAQQVQDAGLSKPLIVQR